MKLRPYQDDMVQRTRAAMARGTKSILIQACTGAGKTALASSMVQSALSKGRTSHFAVHRRLLLKQTEVTFKEFNIDYSYIASGYLTNPYNGVHICSIDTLKSRLDKIKIPDILWIDECHMANSEGWSKVIDYYKARGSWVIGLSATPWRLDGSGLSKHFDEMICGPSMNWLIENKFLSKYRMFAPSAPDLSGIHTRMGDYAQNELAALLEADNVLVGDAIKHYKKYADGKLGLYYAVSRKHSEFIAEQFRNAGIPAMHMDGETPDSERKRIINAFANREVKVITNVEIATTGFDLAAQVGRDITVECIGLLRPTKSLSLYLQMVGRGLRAKDEAAIILDHASCAATHGLPDQVHEWSLDDRDRKKKSNTGSDVIIRQCPSCYHSHYPKPQCPECGYIYLTKYREVEHVDGDLTEIDYEKMREAQKWEDKRRLFDCKTLDEIIKEGYRRGYRPGNCETWAAKVLSYRLAKASGGKR